MKNMFDREEMIRLSREGMESSMRFFNTLNENILKMGEWQKEVVNETVKRNLETMNKAYDEYQKQQRVILNRIETACRDALKTADAPKTHENGK